MVRAMALEERAQKVILLLDDKGSRTQYVRYPNAETRIKLIAIKTVFSFLLKYFN